MPCFSQKQRIALGVLVLFCFWFTDKTVSLSVVALSMIVISECLLRLVHMVWTDDRLPAPTRR